MIRKMKMLTEIEKVLPSEIEKRSFEIITEELGDKKLVPGTELIVKRCIHTSADFDSVSALRKKRTDIHLDFGSEKYAI